ncbi:splicing factor RRM domain-containing protein [Cryptosporidium canis]|uniref:Splicing factor RRM domain-containing protein n=1 Tax=Cryptosporidium canis TaxID=195482 RepID=A0ABQ8P4G6_9CRYT|nr:splicing factor RRM domain-containing protein [Cryptosporidium canis]KAJ1608729.1 splicing factor RRM domain-containing protein [Cryptosporidium canis]
MTHQVELGDDGVGGDSSAKKVYIDYNDEAEEGRDGEEKDDESKSPSRERCMTDDEQRDVDRRGECVRDINEERGRSRSRENPEHESSDGCSLLVRNLRYETSPGRVRHHFERYGPVRDVYLPLDYYSRRPRGFGFVEYMDPRDAQDAVSRLDGSLLDGSTIRVVVAHDRRKSPETMRRIQRDSRNPRSGGYPSRYDGRPSGGYHHDHGYRGGRYRDDYYGGRRQGGYRDDERGSYRNKRRYQSRSPSYHSPRGRSASRSPYRGGSASRDHSHSIGRDPYQGKRYRK